jgi:hypothetical protein
VRYRSMLRQCKESHQRFPSALHTGRCARTCYYSYYKNGRSRVHQTNNKHTTWCRASKVTHFCTKSWWRSSERFLLAQAHHGSLEQLPFGPHRSATQRRGAVRAVWTPSLPRKIGFFVGSRGRFVFVSMGCGAERSPSSRQRLCTGSTQSIGSTPAPHLSQTHSGAAIFFLEKVYRVAMSSLRSKGIGTEVTGGKHEFLIVIQV